MASRAIVFFAFSCFFAWAVLANEVTDEVNKVIDEMKAEIEAMKAEINKDGQAVAAAVGGEINGAYQSLDKTVEEAAKKAAAAGIDITSCTKSLNTTVEGDVNKRTQNAVGCITNEMNNALTQVETELKAVEEAEKDVQDGEDKLKACNKLSAWKKAKCIAEETAKLVQQAKSIKNEMTTAKDTLVKIAANYQQDIKSCENGELNGAESDAKQAGESFAACVLLKGIHL